MKSISDLKVDEMNKAKQNAFDRRCAEESFLRFDLKSRTLSLTFARTLKKRIRFIKMRLTDYRSHSDDFFTASDLVVAHPDVFRSFTLEEFNHSFFSTRSIDEGDTYISSKGTFINKYDSIALEEAFACRKFTNVHILNDKAFRDIPDGTLVEADVSFLAVLRENKVIVWEEGFFQNYWCPTCYFENVEVVKKKAIKAQSLGSWLYEKLLCG